MRYAPTCDPTQPSAMIMLVEKLHHRGRADHCSARHGAHGRLYRLARHSPDYTIAWCDGSGAGCLNTHFARVVLIPIFRFLYFFDFCKTRENSNARNRRRNCLSECAMLHVARASNGYNKWRHNSKQTTRPTLYRSCCYRPIQAGQRPAGVVFLLIIYYLYIYYFPPPAGVVFLLIISSHLTLQGVPP